MHFVSENYWQKVSHKPMTHYKNKNILCLFNSLLYKSTEQETDNTPSPKTTHTVPSGQIIDNDTP